ncbi:MAG: alpha-amylase, partial [Actinomycetes bacterium]
MFMAERCGSWQVGDDRDAGAVEFRVFYPAGVDPGVTDIRVIGDFQPHVGGSAWDPATGLPLVRDDTDPRGTFWRAESPTPLPSDFYAYAYAVRFADGSVREVADPCARYSGLTPQRSGIVVGGSRPADNVVRPLAGGRRPLGDLGIYELMIDDFTAGYRGGRAPLRAVMDRLDHVAGLGFDAIEFMPWTAWRHVDFDWGYEPFQYFAVESRYANDA